MKENIPSGSSMRWSDPQNPGNCLCYPKSEECRSILKSFNLEGIEYRDNEPLFNICAEATVSIPMMSHKRHNTDTYGRKKIVKPISSDASDDEVLANKLNEWMSNNDYVGNFDQADFILSQEWTKSRKDGHTWTKAMVAAYRTEKHLTWHERSDGIHCDLIPQKINQEFSHTGGTGKSNYQHRLASKVNEEYERENGKFDLYSDEMPSTLKEKNCRMVELTTFFALMLSSILSFILTDTSSIYTFIGWILSTIGMYILPLILCSKSNKVREMIDSKKGGIILIIYILVFNILNIFLARVIGFGLLIVVGYWVISAGTSIFGAFVPTGRIRIERHEADGSINVEDHYVYAENMDSEMRKAETQLKNEGYNVKKD